MRIGFVGNVPPPFGGAEVHLERVATELKRRGFKVVVFRKNPASFYTYPLKVVYLRQYQDFYHASPLRGAHKLRNCLPIQNLHLRDKLVAFYDRVFRFRVFSKLMENMDFVHINGVPTAHHVAAAISGFNKPIFVTAHGPAEFFNKRKLPRITHAFAVSEFTKKLFIRAYSPDFGITTVYNPVDTSLFKPGKPNGDGLLFLGRLAPEKNLGMLLKAISDVDLDCKLHIAGDGPAYPDIYALANKICPKKVEFHGAIENKQVPDFLTLGNILVFTSNLESLPIAMLEAMSCSKTVIAPRIGGIPEFIEEGRTGFLFEPDNFKELGKKIALARNDSNLRRRIGRNARKLVARRCETGKVVDSISATYRLYCP